MQESVYKALKRQKLQQKETQLSAKNWEEQEGFENLVFTTTTGKPMTEHSFQVALDGIENAINKERKEVAVNKKKAYEPIPHFYPHALRHTFATRCFEAGIDAKVVQGYLGHYSIAITLDLYTHVTDDKARTEMNKLENKNNYKIGILIGPEGGIDSKEIEILKENGAVITTLGKRILRTEIAPIAMVSNILYELEN